MAISLADPRACLCQQVIHPMALEQCPIMEVMLRLQGRYLESRLLGSTAALQLRLLMEEQQAILMLRK